MYSFHRGHVLLSAEKKVPGKYLLTDSTTVLVFSTFTTADTSVPFSALLSALENTLVNYTYWVHFPSVFGWIGKQKSHLWEERETKVLFLPPFSCQAEVLAVAAPFGMHISCKYNLCLYLVTSVLLPIEDRELGVRASYSWQLVGESPLHVVSFNST